MRKWQRMDRQALAQRARCTTSVPAAWSTERLKPGAAGLARSDAVRARHAPGAGCARVGRARSRRTCARDDRLPAPLGPGVPRPCRPRGGSRPPTRCARRRRRPSAQRCGEGAHEEYVPDARPPRRPVDVDRVRRAHLAAWSASHIQLWSTSAACMVLRAAGRHSAERAPDDTGARRLRAGYTWGMSIRLSDVRLFAPTKNLTLFLTITKVWVPGATAYDQRVLQPAADSTSPVSSLAPRKHTKQVVPPATHGVHLRRARQRSR